MIPKTITVRLLKAHRHGGKQYAPGATIAGLPVALATWLRSQGVAEVVDGNQSANTRTSAPLRRASCCGGRW
jgi:hypothetical protein